MNGVETERELPGVAVRFDGPDMAVPHPKVTAWTWVCYYAWNLYRRPRVWRKQRELRAITATVIECIQKELLPQLALRRGECLSCRTNYEILKVQRFVSQIELILKRGACETHRDIYRRFMTVHSHYFVESEKIARWINGFA